MSWKLIWFLRLHQLKVIIIKNKVMEQAPKKQEESNNPFGLTKEELDDLYNDDPKDFMKGQH